MPGMGPHAAMSLSLRKLIPREAQIWSRGLLSAASSQSCWVRHGMSPLASDDPGKGPQPRDKEAMAAVSRKTCMPEAAWAKGRRSSRGRDDGDV